MPHRLFGEVAKGQVDACLEPVHTPLLHHVKPQLAEAEPCLVVAEKQPEHVANRSVGVARCVAVSMLQAEVAHAANDEAAQILVGEQCRRHERGEDVHRRARDRIGHPRQFEQRFDRAVAELAPHPRIFLPDILLRRMRRPMRRRCGAGSRDRHLTARSLRPRVMKRSTRSRVTVERSGRLMARHASSAKRASASPSSPVRNLHSARCSSSAKVSSCRRSQPASGSRASPVAK